MVGDHILLLRYFANIFKGIEHRLHAGAVQYDVAECVNGVGP